MNINNGKTGNVNIPGALHSTGGDGDGQVGGVVAYAGDIYDETLEKNQKEINQILLDGSGDSNVIAVALNDLNEKVEEQEKVTSTGLNDLNEKIDNNEKSTSAALNDLNDKVDNLNDTVQRAFESSITTTAVVNIAVEKSGLHYDNDGNFVSYIPNGTNLAYTPNTITDTSGSILIGKSNNLIEGNDSVVIGKENYNVKDYNVTIGTQNRNDSLYGINIGHYNYNFSDVDNNISIGRDNQIYKDIDGIVIGSYNSIARFTTTQNGQKTIAIGKGLFTDNDNITLGFYNAYYSDGAVMPKFAVANGTASNDRSNIIEQYDNGDLFIKGLGGFTGANSQYNRNTPNECKTLQQIITDLTSRIATLEAQISGGNS